MKLETKLEYIDNVVSGCIPEQETYSKEEVMYLSKTLLIWAAEQIHNSISQIEIEDIPSMVKECDYKTIEEATKDIQDSTIEELSELKKFISTWLY